MEEGVLEKSAHGVGRCRGGGADAALEEMLEWLRV